MQYSSSSPFQLTLSLLCIHLLCRQNIFMTMSCSREYFIRDQERRKQVYTVDKENFESNWKNFLCLSFLSCPPFKFQRQKKKRIKAKNDIQLNCLKQLHIMHTQKDKNPKFLNQDVLGRKQKPCYQESYQEWLPYGYFHASVCLFGAQRRWSEPM